MIDRTTCSGKFEVLYKELEMRADELITSADELKNHGCLVTDNSHILDCVIGLDEHRDCTGHVTTEKHRFYRPYHFVVKRSTNKIGNKQSILISADWLEDMVNYWKKNINPRENMVIVMLYEDFYFFFKVDSLLNQYNFGSPNFYDKYVKTIPCYNHNSKTKEPNRVMLLPINWAEKYMYLSGKEEREAIYRADKARKDKQTQSTTNPLTNISSLV